MYMYPSKHFAASEPRGLPASLRSSRQRAQKPAERPVCDAGALRPCGVIRKPEMNAEQDSPIHDFLVRGSMHAYVYTNNVDTRTDRTGARETSSARADELNVIG